MIISACGLICNECEHYGTNCNGCKAVAGQTFWALEMMPNKTCPLFDCSVNQRKYSDCGGCSELPCNLFVTMKDPSSTDEEHIASIKKRTDILKGSNT
jgi:hypothetical protein